MTSTTNHRPCREMAGSLASEAVLRASRACAWVFALALLIPRPAGAQEAAESAAPATPASPAAAGEVLGGEATVPPRSLQLAPGQKLRDGDAVLVRVLDEATVSGAFRIGEDGCINYPLLGKVQAAGLSLDELALEIKQQLERDYIRKADVAVTMTDRQQSSVYLYGAVRSQGPVNFDPSAGISLGRAVAMVGGTSELANPSRVKIERSSGNEMTSLYADLGSQQDFSLEDGDIVVVPIRPELPVAREVMQQQEPEPATGRAIVMGQVNRTGAVPVLLEGGTDILEVIAVSGGFTRLARPSRVRVRRQMADGSTENLTVDVDRMNRGEDTQGFRVLPGDTIFVPESVF